MLNWAEKKKKQTTLRWGTPYPTKQYLTPQTKIPLPELRLICFLFEKGNALTFRHQINTKTLEVSNFPYGTWKEQNFEALGDEIKWQQHPPAKQSPPLHCRQWQILRDWLFHPAGLLVPCYAKTQTHTDWKEGEKKKKSSQILGFGPAREAPLPLFHQVQEKRAFKMNCLSIFQ